MGTQYLTTDAAAPVYKLTPDQLRRRAAAGLIPGAIRLSGRTGPWRFPDPRNDDTPPSAGDAVRGVSADTGTGSDADTSADPGQMYETVRRVSRQVAAVSSRPARALDDVLHLLVVAAARHTPNRDGWCATCGWQYPCADALAAQRIVNRAAAVVLDGAR